MKSLIFVFLLFYCANLSAQVLIDQPKKEPDLIARSNLDTVDASYLTESGIFKGYVVKKEYTVNYAAENKFNGYNFEVLVQVLDDKKEPVKKFLAYKEHIYLARSSSTNWTPYYYITPNKE